MQLLNNLRHTLERCLCTIGSWRLSSRRAIMLVSLIPMMNVTATSASETSLSVPVRILAAPQPAPQMDSMRPARRPAPEATPAARMPQYQLHQKDLGDPGDPNSPHLRFVLALPGQPLLIEASILIDGQPFRQARERRVQAIMQYLSNPEAFKAEEARIAAEAQAEADRIAAQAEADATNPPSLLESINALITPSDEAATPTPEPTPAPEDASSNDEAKSEEAPPESTETPAAAVVAAEPAVSAVPKYMAPATIYERIDRYTRSTGTSPSADEVRWLLTNWVDGPMLLFLNDNFQRFRADQQPVYKVLDRDRDGKLSAEELAQCVASFQECDLNRDGIVEATELAQAAADPRDQPTSSSTGKLVFRLPDEASAVTFLRRLAVLYPADGAMSRLDGDGDGVLSPEELKQLNERPADIRLKVELNTRQPESSRLTIESFSDDFASLKDAAKANPSSMTLNFPTFNLEFVAAQESSSDQISIGAVNDGYAMLQEIDPNTDGRFSVRELRQLKERLTAFDRNSDGQITSDETQPTFRVCIGLGPIAHRPLALLREVNASASETLVQGPEWFTEMDKNKDYDLTRQEFPGTDEQFKQLDSDGDGLISSVEANTMENGP